jgi:hypothetical protein
MAVVGGMSCNGVTHGCQRWMRRSSVSHVTNVDHNVHTIHDRKNHDRAPIALTQLCGVKAPLRIDESLAPLLVGPATAIAVPVIVLTLA